MRRSARGARRMIATALVAALIPGSVLLSACSSDPDPVAALTAAAEAAVPGELTVLSSRTTGDGSAEVVFGLRDAPDAGLVLRTGAGSQISADGVRSEVRDARARAERYRLLDGSFRRCGFTIVAIAEPGRPSHETVWISTSDAGPLDRIPHRLRPCQADWAAADGEPGPVVKLAGAVGLPAADPTTAPTADSAADPALPALLRMTSKPLLDTLRISAHHTVEIRPRDGWVRPEWPPEQWQDIRPQLSAEISRWLGELGVDHVTGLEAHGQRRLVPSTPGRMRYYEQICTERDTSWRCRGPMIGVAAVTVDLDDLSVSAPRLITTVREPRQIPLDTALEPELAGTPPQ